MLRVNNHAAATLIRQRTLEQGLDPRDFVVYAYGGAGRSTHGATRQSSAASRS